jgi:hypothetical protein
MTKKDCNNCHGLTWPIQFEQGFLCH